MEFKSMRVSVCQRKSNTRLSQGRIVECLGYLDRLGNAIYQIRLLYWTNKPSIQGEGVCVCMIVVRCDEHGEGHQSSQEHPQETFTGYAMLMSRVFLVCMYIAFVFCF